MKASNARADAHQDGCGGEGEPHPEAKRNLYLGGLRLSEVEGGRFCEAAFRLLEHVTQGSFTPLGTQLNTDQTIQKLENLPKGSHLKA